MVPLNVLYLRLPAVFPLEILVEGDRLCFYHSVKLLFTNLHKLVFKTVKFEVGGVYHGIFILFFL